MRRALMTAQGIHDETGIDVKVWTDVHENGGCYIKGDVEPGMNVQDIEAEFPFASIGEGVTDKGWYLEEAKETEEQAYQRAKRVVQELYALSSSGQYKAIALISHGNFLNTLLNAFADRSPAFSCENAFADRSPAFSCYYLIENCGLVITNLTEEHKAVFTSINYNTHLEELESERMGISKFVYKYAKILSP
eukprot:CAMPEP_0114976506 /NCGR_PEP_ID=MMETSP0216-20121206/2711_1 /TAXON_ID=223996 /ORGANISM="Protocruzia adherens, Strain Boccale" /LENGTH=191 /DNA_ID=CAMNT_0002337443 /DNA_START=862 /DNA_END=1437 /DNA_ORIENTATION=+